MQLTLLLSERVYNVPEYKITTFFEVICQIPSLNPEKMFGEIYQHITILFCAQIETTNSTRITEIIGIFLF
jgi:hypothetical protein